MSAHAIPFITEEEYLKIERAAERPIEYYRGEMYPIEAATGRHAIISANLGRLIGNALVKRPCTVFAAGAKVKVSSSGLYACPDWLVVCGQTLYSDKYKDSILNPVLLVEVLSPTTEDHDRGFKFVHYTKIDSAQEYVLAAQSAPRVGVFRRQPNRADWLWTEVEGLGSKLVLSSLEIEIPLAEIYDKVEFEPE